jgi:hypothetical protein
MKVASAFIKLHKQGWKAPISNSGRVDFSLLQDLQTISGIHSSFYSMVTASIYEAGPRG